jgi:CRP-like cAMP-binding protein
LNTDKLFDNLHLLHSLPEGFRMAVERELQEVTLPRGYYLVPLGTIARDVYFLDQGFAVSFRFQEGKKVVTAFWARGAIIVSPKSFCEQSPAEEIIQLTTESRLFSLSRTALLAVASLYPAAGFLAGRVVAREHAQRDEHIAELHDPNTSNRYAALLRRFPGIEQHVAQDLVASYLNIIPQSLSRLKKRERENLR